jgi:hypothetical protein
MTGEKKGVKDTLLGQAEPKTAIETSALVVAKNHFSFRECLAAGEKSQTARGRRSPLPTAIGHQSLWSVVQGHRVVIEVVVGGNEVHLFVLKQEFDHAAELTRKIKVVIFSEINNFAFLLPQKDVYLLRKCGLIADRGERNEN